MKLKRVISNSIVLIAVMILASCQQTPKEVKEKYSSSFEQSDSSSSMEQTDNSTNSSESIDDAVVDKVDVSNLELYNEKLAEFVKQKKYDKNFILSEKIKIITPSELYSFKLKQIDNAQMKFPEIFKLCFGRDFEKESGVSDVGKLKHASPDDKISGFFYDNTSVTQAAYYIDPNGFNSEDGTYNTSLSVGKGGFVYYENQYDGFDEYSCCKQVFYNRNESDNQRLKMSDGSSYSCDEAKEYAEKYINKLYSSINSNFEYRVGIVKDCKNKLDKHILNMTIQKVYKDTIMTDLFVGNYPSSTHTKSMYYECTVSGRDKIVMVDAPFGFEAVESSERITDKVIPVTTALEILHNKLAEQIKLNITDIKLMYYNEYDASEYEKVKALAQNSGDFNSLSKEQQSILMHPSEKPNMEFNCYPVWVFYVQKPLNVNEYGIQTTMLYDYILVNAQTGEMINYIDCGTVY